MLVKRKDVVDADICRDTKGIPYMKNVAGKTVIKTAPVEIMHGNEFHYDEQQMIQALKEGMSSKTQVSHINFNHRGWTSVIAEVDKKWIAKFPRSSGSYNHLLREGRALDAIRPQLNFFIPERNFADASLPFFFHKKLIGEHFGPDAYAKATEEEQNTFIQSAASVLAQINDTPVARMAGLIPEMTFNLPDEDGLCSTLSECFSPWELEQARIIARRFGELDRPASHKKVGLFDFHGYNVVVNPKTKKITGVFDFDELAIGDFYFCLREARLHYGDEVGRKVCESYEALTETSIDKERLDLCFKGWYLFEHARYIRNQKRLEGIAHVGGKKHTKRIRAFLREEGKNNNITKQFKPKRRDFI